METPVASTLLCIWERGAQQSAVNRGLLLLTAAFPDRAREQLARMTMGERDSALLTLRERLFGSRVECLTSCAACGETIEVEFAVDDIRAGFGRADETHEVEVSGRVVSFRLPNSLDMRDVECDADALTAQQALLSRCVVSRTEERLSEALIAAIDRRMGELDAQAQVQLDLACPACTRSCSAAFNVAPFLWTEIERWARTLLREVHVLARAYGWSEAEVLALGPARRQVYLEMVTT
jgi:hypothetical protein